MSRSPDSRDGPAVAVLSSQEIERHARPAFEQVFASADSQAAPIKPDVGGRFLLYPCPSGELEAGQFAALAAAAADAGDPFAFLTDTQSLASRKWAHPGRMTWRVPLAGYDAYSRISHPSGAPRLESALYSPRGTWGLLFSDEYWAVGAGSESFRAAFLSALPDPRALVERYFVDVQITMLLAGLVDDKEAIMVEAWLRTWSANRASGDYATDWVPRLLDHIYGVGVGARIRDAFGWDAPPGD
jgi:hypothetical protein